MKEGLNLEQTARKLAGNRADVVRDAVESRVGQARERAADTWDRLEKVFEDRVQRALVKLGVPGRDDLAALADRVDALTAELRRQGGKPAASLSGQAALRQASAARRPGQSRPPRRPRRPPQAVAKPSRRSPVSPLRRVRRPVAAPQHTGQRRAAPRDR